jgi:hypothetical protein
MREPPSVVRFLARFLLSVVFATTATPGWAAVRDVTPEEAAQIEGYEGETQPRGRATLGGRVGENLSEGYLDVLQPLAGGERGLLFFNPKLSGSDNDEEEYSLGLGFRMLCPAVDAIAGANLFYDSRDSRNGNTFDQVGAGVEVLTTWVDARANYYWPDDKQELIDRESDTEVDRDTDYFLSDIYAEGHQLLQLERIKTTTTTTTRYFERFEAAMEGYDAELGAKLPFLPPWMETRVFAGYYNFEGDFTKDVDGFRGRLEIRAMPALTLDAEFYDNDDLTGSDYFFGARVNLPFDVVNLAHGRNPFAGTRETLAARQQAFRERLSEMVIRDPHVRLHESGFIENEDLKDVDVDVEVDEDEKVILDDINFVSNGNNSGFENGTDEHPYNTVQEGVDNVFGEKNVYVYQGVGSYRENVRIETDGVRLLGEGCAITGLGGEKFGGGKFPVLDGNVAGVNGPVIRVSSADVLIRGLELTHSAGGFNAGASDALGLGQPIDEVGILGENADNLTIQCNRIHNSSYGVLGLYDPTEPGATQDYTIQVLENQIYDSAQGVALYALGSGSGRLDALLEDNVLEDISSIEIFGIAQNLADARLTIRGNKLNDPGASMQLVLANITNNAGLNISGNTFREGGVIFPVASGISNDLDVAISGNTLLEGPAPSVFQLVAGPVGGDLTLTMDDNYIRNGLMLALPGTVAGDALISISGNTLLDAAGGAITLVGGQVGGNTTLLLDSNRIVDPQGAGITAVASSLGGDFLASISGNEISGAQGAGVTLVSGGVVNDVNLSLNNNRISNNQGTGLFVSTGSATGDVVMVASDNQINQNAGGGLFLNLGPVAGDASLAVLDSEFNGNSGAGLTLIAPSVQGTLDVLVDPTSANNNTGGGMSLVLTSTDDLSLSLEDVTANDNTGPGITVIANSISGSVQAAFLDVEANRNSGGGVTAVLTANDTLFVGRQTPALEGNQLVANGNAGQGFLLIGTSTSGQVVSLTQRMETSGNNGGGSSRILTAPDQIVVSDAEVVANDNVGLGMNLLATSTNDEVMLQVGRLEASRNTGGGASLTLSGLQSAAAFMGVETPFLYIAQPANPGLQLNGNTGGGLTAFLNSQQGGARMGLGETEANNNTGNGLSLNLIAKDQAFLIMGVSGLSLSGQFARVQANNNNGNGISANLSSESDEALLFMLDGQANDNFISGMNATMTAGDDVIMGVGLVPFSLDSVGSFEASRNKNGHGLDVVGVSTGGSVQLLLANTTAISNALNGINANLSGLDGASAVFGSYLGPIRSPVTVRGNGQDGVHLLATAPKGEITLIAGDVNASGNTGDGFDATLSAREEVRLIMGLGSDGGTNIVLRPVLANRNGGSGFLLNATSVTNELALLMVDFVANSNSAVGLQANLTAYSNVFVNLGGLNGEFIPVTVAGHGQVIGNGQGGITLDAVSTEGSISSRFANVTANNNTVAGPAAVDISLTASQNVWATMHDSVINNNNGVAGLDLRYEAGGDASIELDNVQINNNTGANFVRSLNPSGNALVTVRNVTATNNSSSLGLFAGAVANQSATVVVENVVANDNFQGVDLYARASAGAALVSISNLVANNNTSTGVEGDALAFGGNAQIRVRDVTANNNGTYGVELLAVNSGATEARVLVSDDLTVNNNKTGALFAARSDGTAVVLFNAVNNVSASNNANHGIVGAAEGDFGSVSLSAGPFPAVNNNGQYGLVALAVGTNGNFVSASNPSGTGNGSGNTFTDSSTTGPWEALLP